MKRKIMSSGQKRSVLKTAKENRLKNKFVATRRETLDLKKVRAEMRKYYSAERKQRRMIANKHARILAKILGILENARNDKLALSELISKSLVTEFYSRKK